MSYILDALKKAAEQRSGPPPEVRRLLSAPYVPARSPSRALMLTVAGAAVLGVAVGLWVWTPVHELAAPTGAPVTSLATVPNASSLPPAAAHDDKPRVAPEDKPRPSLTPIGASDEPHTAASEPRRAPTKPRVAETAPPHTAPPGIVSPAPAVVASRPPSAVASPAPAPRAVAPVAPVPPTPRVVTSHAPAPRVVASLPPAGAPAAQRADVGKMKVEVIVYAEERPHRWAFINGRKYVEGDAIGDGARIEEIQSNGVVVVEGGRRVTLRP